MAKNSRVTFLKSARFGKPLLLLTSQLPFLGGFGIAQCFGQGKLLPTFFNMFSKVGAKFKVFKTRSCFPSCQNSELKFELPNFTLFLRAVEFYTFSWGCQILRFFHKFSKLGVKLGAVKIRTFLVGQLFTHTFYEILKNNFFLLGSQLPTFFRWLSKLKVFYDAVKLTLFSWGNYLPYVFTSFPKSRFFDRVNICLCFFNDRQNLGLISNYSKRVVTGLYWASPYETGRKR